MIGKISIGDRGMGARIAADNRCSSGKASPLDQGRAMVSQMNGHGLIRHLKYAVFHGQCSVVLEEAPISCGTSCVEAAFAGNDQRAAVYNQVLAAVRKADGQRFSIHV